MINEIVYKVLELILIILFVISVYNFVRLYVYHDDDKILRSIHDIIMSLVLILSVYLLYKSCYKNQKYKRFYLHVYISFVVIAIIGLVNSAKRIESLK